MPKQTNRPKTTRVEITKADVTQAVKKILTLGNYSNIVTPIESGTCRITRASILR